MTRVMVPRGFTIQKAFDPETIEVVCDECGNQMCDSGPWPPICLPPPPPIIKRLGWKHRLECFRYEPYPDPNTIGG